MPELTPEQVKAHAVRLASIELECMEFCAVYEDEDLEDVGEDDQLAIHNMIVSGGVKAVIA